MRLVCPACGAMCSAEAWQNDATSRAFMDLLLRFPNDVKQQVLPYLGLFRVGKSGLTWSRAYRLLSELQGLLERGEVQWEGGESRPAPSSLWAQALDAVLTRRPKALANHNYLRHVAWEMAGPLASRRERQVEESRVRREYQAPEIEAEAAISEEERKAVKEQLRGFFEQFGK